MQCRVLLSGSGGWVSGGVSAEWLPACISPWGPLFPKFLRKPGCLPTYPPSHITLPAPPPSLFLSHLTTLLLHVLKWTLQPHCPEHLDSGFAAKGSRPLFSLFPSPGFDLRLGEEEAEEVFLGLTFRENQSQTRHGRELPPGQTLFRFLYLRSLASEPPGCRGSVTALLAESSFIPGTLEHTQLPLDRCFYPAGPLAVTKLSSFISKILVLFSQPSSL